MPAPPSTTTSPPHSKWWGLLIIVPIASIILDGSLVMFRLPETRAFTVVFTLFVLGMLALLDRDRQKKAGSTLSVLASHANALALGAALGILENVLRRYGDMGNVHLEAFLIILVILPGYFLASCLAIQSWISFLLCVTLALHGFTLALVYQHLVYEGFYMDEIIGVLSVLAACAAVIAIPVLFALRRFSVRRLPQMWLYVWSWSWVGGLVVWWLAVRR